VKKLRLILVLIFVCTGLVFAQADRQKALYVSTIDGDTIKVFFDSSTQTVRMLSIDTPESKANRKAKRDAKAANVDVADIVKEGKKSTEYTRKLLSENPNIELEFDAEKRDRYSRLLAYVWLNKDTMLNELLLKGKYAVPMVYGTTTKYLDIFGPPTYGVKSTKKQDKPASVKKTKTKKQAPKETQNESVEPLRAVGQ
jgi:micrococcal nuclease